MKEKLGSSHKASLKNMDKILLIATLVLLVVGILSIVSASSRETVARYDYSVYHFFFQHMKMIGISVVFSLLLLRFPTKYYKLFAPLLWFVILGLVIGLFIYGSAKGRGSLNWLSIFGFVFQPSEFAKPVIIVTLAIAFERLTKYLKQSNANKWTYTAIWLVIGMFIPVIVFFQGDLGTAIIIAGISAIMYFFGPLDKQKRNSCIRTLLLGLVALVGILYASRGYIFSDEQKDRLTKFLNPCSKYEETGYQICNGFIAINDGGLIGLGIGKSKQKYSYIPDPHTDSIFAIVVEETGVLVGILIIGLYTLIIIRILKISQNASSVRGRYIAFGVAVYLFFHIILNLGGLLGIMPLTGVPLPLISYGGTFTISFLSSLAVVQRICMENYNQPIKIK